MINKKFKSLFVVKEKNTFQYKIKTHSIKSLDKKEVIIKVKYSSFNYKDFLVCTGNYWDARRYPIIPGIDFAGKVVLSKSSKFKAGDKVIIIASPAGSKINGGLSEYTKINACWVNEIPNKLSEKDSMIFGTAGFTSMYIVQKILKSKVNKKLPILVTGGSGGVSSLLIFILSKMGFKIIASTRTAKNIKYLKSIGADQVILDKNIKTKDELSLQKRMYSACIDTVGGKNLSYILKRLVNAGICYSVGFSKSNDSVLVNLTPFILRGVKLDGIHTESVDKKKRDYIWKKISLFIKLNPIPASIYSEYKLNKIKEIINKFSLIKKGKFLIKIN